MVDVCNCSIKFEGQSEMFSGAGRGGGLLRYGSRAFSQAECECFLFSFFNPEVCRDTVELMSLAEEREQVPSLRAVAKIANTSKGRKGDENQDTKI